MSSLLFRPLQTLPSSLSTRTLVGSVLVGLLSGFGCKSDTNYVPLSAPPPLASDHGQWLSMDVGPDGSIVATFYDRGRGAIGFARGEPRGDEVWWSYEEIDGYPTEQGLNPGDRGRFTSVEVASDGRVWASYQDVDNGSLRVAVRDGTSWTTELADAGVSAVPQVGAWTSLALDAENRPIVAHYDAGRGALRVARRDSDGDWSAEEVWTGLPYSGYDEEGAQVQREASVGTFARLVVHDGIEYLAFYDAGQQTLHLLEGTAGEYSHTLVDDTGNVGAWPSLWTDGETTYIAYHDVGNQDLKLATREGAGPFTLQTIDDGELVGADTEVFLDGDAPSILYFDGQNNDAKLATSNGSTWSIRSVGEEGVATGYHNEVVRAADRWWAASYDYTHRRIHIQPL